jgi:hypothetical protein
MKRGTAMKKLVRTDLSTFDDNATKVVLAAMDMGASGRITANGHAFILAPNGGGTMSVSRDTSAPNCLKNIEADFRRLFGAPKNVAPATPAPATDESITVITQTNAPSSIPADEDMIPCPAKGCEKEFVTMGAKIAHVRDEHFTCDWEGPDVDHDDPNYRCDLSFNGDGTAYVGLTANAVGGHKNVRHRGNKPWEHIDPAGRHEAALKGARTRAAARGGKPEPQKQERPTPALFSGLRDSHGHPAVVAPSAPTFTVQGTGTLRPSQPKNAEAVLQAIRELLGEDPQVAKLKSEVEDLTAQLDLIAEAMHLRTPKKKG